MVEGYSRTVRPGRIGVFILHLCVSCTDRDIAVLCDSPLDDRGTVVLTCIDIVTLDLQPVVAEVFIVLFVIRLHVVCIERIIAVAALENKSIAALLTEIIFHICPVLTCIRAFYPDRILIFQSVDIDHCDIQRAAVIR